MIDCIRGKNWAKAKMKSQEHPNFPKPKAPPPPPPKKYWREFNCVFVIEEGSDYEVAD